MENIYVSFFEIFRNFKFFRFGWGAAGFGWGAKAPPDPPLNGRTLHLIKAAKRGRLDQMLSTVVQEGVWGGFAPPAKNRGVWGAATPSQN